MTIEVRGGQRVSRAKPIDAVRNELDNEHANAGLPLPARATDRLLAAAERLHAAHTKAFATDPVPWSDLSTVSVRAWVAVAREAGRL